MPIDFKNITYLLFKQSAKVKNMYLKKNYCTSLLLTSTCLMKSNNEVHQRHDQEDTHHDGTRQIAWFCLKSQATVIAYHQKELPFAPPRTRVGIQGVVVRT